MSRVSKKTIPVTAFIAMTGRNESIEQGEKIPHF